MMPCSIALSPSSPQTLPLSGAVAPVELVVPKQRPRCLAVGIWRHLPPDSHNSVSTISDLQEAQASAEPRTWHRLPCGWLPPGYARLKAFIYRGDPEIVP